MVRQEAPACESCGSRHKSLLSNCSPVDLQKVDCGKTCGNYKKGEHLFHEGGYPQGLFCIHKGSVKIFKTGLEGKEQILHFAQPGDFVGYTALITEQPYIVSALALQDAVVCYISRETFQDMVRTNPMLNRELIKALCRELDIEQTRLMNMAQKNVRERLAETLLMLLDTFRNSRGRPELIDVTLPREDIANLVGTATESVIRLLSEFKRDGLIDTEGKKIIVRQEQKLRRIGRMPVAAPAPQQRVYA